MGVVSGGGGGGSSLPVLARNVGQVEFTFSQSVSAVDGLKHLTLAYGSGDATMVSLTDDANPTIVTAGLYAFNCSITVGAPTNNAWSGGMLVDDNFYSYMPLQGHTDGLLLASSSVAATWWCDAGDPFAAIAVNAENGTPGAVPFTGRMLVQRIR